jgi:hypothetical protein
MAGQLVLIGWEVFAVLTVRFALLELEEGHQLLICFVWEALVMDERALYGRCREN